jgi:hypothetical protein
MSALGQSGHVQRTSRCLLLTQSGHQAAPLVPSLFSQRPLSLCRCLPSQQALTMDIQRFLTGLGLVILAIGIGRPLFLSSYSPAAFPDAVAGSDEVRGPISR